MSARGKGPWALELSGPGRTAFATASAALWIVDRKVSPAEPVHEGECQTPALLSAFGESLQGRATDCSELGRPRHALQVEQHEHCVCTPSLQQAAVVRDVRGGLPWEIVLGPSLKGARRVVSGPTPAYEPPEEAD